MMSLFVIALCSVGAALDIGSQGSDDVRLHMCLLWANSAVPQSQELSFSSSSLSTCSGFWQHGGREWGVPGPASHCGSRSSPSLPVRCGFVCEMGPARSRRFVTLALKSGLYYEKLHVE